MNFGNIYLGSSKNKVLRITNVNPIPISIDTVQKNTFDDLTISILKIINLHGK